MSHFLYSLLQLPFTFNEMLVSYCRKFISVSTAFWNSATRNRRKEMIYLTLWGRICRSSISGMLEYSFIIYTAHQRTGTASISLMCSPYLDLYPIIIFAAWDVKPYVIICAHYFGLCSNNYISWTGYILCFTVYSMEKSTILSPFSEATRKPWPKAYHSSRVSRLLGWQYIEQNVSIFENNVKKTGWPIFKK